MRDRRADRQQRACRETHRQTDGETEIHTDRDTQANKRKQRGWLYNKRIQILNDPTHPIKKDFTTKIHAQRDRRGNRSGRLFTP